MNKENARDVIERLNHFNPECNQDCHNCEFGVIRSYGDNYSCPIDLTTSLLYMRFFNEKEWRACHG